MRGHSISREYKKRREQADIALAGNIKRSEQEDIAAARNIKRGIRRQRSSREYREERNRKTEQQQGTLREGENKKT